MEDISSLAHVVEQTSHRQINENKPHHYDYYQEPVNQTDHFRYEGIQESQSVLPCSSNRFSPHHRPFNGRDKLGSFIEESTRKPNHQSLSNALEPVHHNNYDSNECPFPYREQNESSSNFLPSIKQDESDLARDSTVDTPPYLHIAKNGSYNRNNKILTNNPFSLAQTIAPAQILHSVSTNAHDDTNETDNCSMTGNLYRDQYSIRQQQNQCTNSSVLLDTRLDDQQSLASIGQLGQQHQRQQQQQSFLQHREQRERFYSDLSPKLEDRVGLHFQPQTSHTKNKLQSIDGQPTPCCSNSGHFLHHSLLIDDSSALGDWNTNDLTVERTSRNRNAIKQQGIPVFDFPIEEVSMQNSQGSQSNSHSYLLEKEQHKVDTSRWQSYKFDHHNPARVQENVWDSFYARPGCGNQYPFQTSMTNANLHLDSFGRNLIDGNTFYEIPNTTAKHQLLYNSSLLPSTSNRDHRSDNNTYIPFYHQNEEYQSHPNTINIHSDTRSSLSNFQRNHRVSSVEPTPYEFTEDNTNISDSTFTNNVAMNLQTTHGVTNSARQPFLDQKLNYITADTSQAKYFQNHLALEEANFDEISLDSSHHPKFSRSQGNSIAPYSAFYQNHPPQAPLPPKTDFPTFPGCNMTEALSINPQRSQPRTHDKRNHHLHRHSSSLTSNTNKHLRHQQNNSDTRMNFENNSCTTGNLDDNEKCSDDLQQNDSDGGGLTVAPLASKRIPNSVLEQMFEQANNFVQHSVFVDNPTKIKEVRLRRTIPIRIKKSKPCLGIGIESGFNVGGQLMPRVVCIHEIGAAYQCGKLRLGDLILEVNGKSTVNMNHAQITETIKNAYNKDPRSHIEFLIGESGYVSK